MKDAMGNELKVDDLIHINMGTIWLRGWIRKIHEGGVIVPTGNPTQKGITGDKLIIEFEAQLADALPGQNHTAILRLVEFDKERLVSKGV